MEQIIFRPKLYKYDTLKAFTDEFKVGGSDLILTNKYIYDPYSDNNKCGAQVIYQEEFGGGEPTDTMVDAIIAEASKKHFERVIAIGGGTVIDIAKVLSVSDGGSVDSLYDHKDSITKLHQLIIIPTTCGTGSEVTNISIINRTRLGVKMGLTSENMFADYAVLVPELLAKLPLKVFGASSIDALVHATESFLSPHRKTMTSELFSEKAMDMILKGFKLIDEKGQDARFEYLDEFVTASFYAGIAFLKAGCGPVHGMSFPLGGTYHVPHGESNYMLFGAIMDYYDANKPDGEIMKFKELVARILGCEVKDAIPEMNALLQRILPLRPLRDCGFTEADFKIFPQSVETNQQRLMTNAYYPFDLESEEAIYRKCY